MGEELKVMRMLRALYRPTAELIAEATGMEVGRILQVLEGLEKRGLAWKFSTRDGRTQRPRLEWFLTFKGEKLCEEMTREERLKWVKGFESRIDWKSRFGKVYKVFKECGFNPVEAAGDEVKMEYGETSPERDPRKPHVTVSVREGEVTLSSEAIDSFECEDLAAQWLSKHGFKPCKGPFRAVKTYPAEAFSRGELADFITMVFFLKKHYHEWLSREWLGRYGLNSTLKDGEKYPSFLDEKWREERRKIREEVERMLTSGKPPRQERGLEAFMR